MHDHARALVEDLVAIVDAAYKALAHLEAVTHKSRLFRVTFFWQCLQIHHAHIFSLIVYLFGTFRSPNLRHLHGLPPSRITISLISRGKLIS